MLWDFSKFADNTALLDEYGIALSYAGLKKESEAVAEGVGRRCLVFCLCRNEIGSILGYVGFVNAGIVPLLLNSQMDSGLLRSLMDAYQPPYMWVPEEMASDFPEAETLRQVFHYVLLKLNNSTEYPLHEDLGLLLTTSGSTGSPKFVRQSYENILDNARAIADYLELDEKERPITTLPMNYTYGFSILHSHFLVGAEVLVTEKSMAQREFRNFFREVRSFTIEKTKLNPVAFRTVIIPEIPKNDAGKTLYKELEKYY